MQHESGNRIVGCVFVALSMAAAVAQQAPQPLLELKRDTPRQSTVAKDQPHSFQITLEEGEFAELEIHVRQGIAQLRLTDPLGVEHTDLTTDTAAIPSFWRWIAPAAGSWLVEVRPAEKADFAEYTLSCRARPATDQDRRLVEADHLRISAYPFFEEGDYARAEALLREAVDLYQEAGGPEHPEVALGLRSLGALANLQGRYKEAEPLYRRSLAILEKILGPENLELAATLRELAILTSRQGRYRDAEPLYDRVLEIRTRVLGPEHLATVDSLLEQGLLYMRQGRYGEAEPIYRRVVELDEKNLGSEHPDFSNSLHSLAVLYFRQGRYRDSEALHRRSLAIREKVLGPKHRWVAAGLGSLAALYVQQGRYGEAEPLLQRMVAIEREIMEPGHPQRAEGLDNLAVVYRVQGRYQDARALHEEALAIRQEALDADHPDIAASFAHLAALHAAQKQYDKAEPLLRQTLAIREKALGPDHPDLAAGLNRLAEAVLESGRDGEAEPLYRRALEIREQVLGPDHPEVAMTLIGLARLAQRLEQREEALRLLDRAIDILDATTGFPEGRIDAYAARARLLKTLGRLEAALEDLGEALLTAEEMRPQSGGGEATRAVFFQRYADEFHRMVAWQLEAGDPEAALEYAERGRARVLLDQLQAGKIDLRAGIPEEVRTSLEQRESEVQARMSEYRQRITLMRGRTDLTPRERGEEISRLTSELDTAHREFDRIYAQIKNASPLWRDLITSGGEPVDLRQIQRQLVPREGLLLFYQLGEEAAHLFAVGPGRGQVDTFPLAVDEPSGRLLGLPPGALTSRSVRRVLGVDAGLFFGPSGNIEPLQEQLHGLWKVLIPGALWSRLKEAAEVVVIPDGALRNFPFESLLVEAGADWPSSRFWLDEGPPIRYAPSATVLYNIERRAGASAMSGQAEGALLLSVADPVYDPGAAETSAEAPRTSTRSAFLRAGGPLARLPGTAMESEAIVTHFGAGQSVALRRGEASESNLRRSLAGKRYLHLATHGLVDEQKGSLFAALALAPPPPGRPVEPEDDGFLQLYEIYELDLADAELAVLSACETSVGPEVEGEGVFALSRGFLASGVRRVIASHWPVDDASTAELMGRAFADIAESERMGVRVDYARALREAKRTLRERPDWSAPFYWAPFTLTGKQ